ncbi:hypothetical protein L798_14423 [Zootermopsis nevadensis]|uniref:Uncharacterized protein n=1 Tax=Zootermopsis nevadensis TaxID=136037 RepID=A0A067QNN2_ZOONE|nr:hypothetical protein L798_14423 [Zootermopsis nevadensis]
MGEVMDQWMNDKDTQCDDTRGQVILAYTRNTVIMAVYGLYRTVHWEFHSNSSVQICYHIH